MRFPVQSRVIVSWLTIFFQMSVFFLANRSYNCNCRYTHSLSPFPTVIFLLQDNALSSEEAQLAATRDILEWWVISFLSLSLSLSHTHTHTLSLLSLSLSLTHTHTHALSLSLSVSLFHTVFSPYSSEFSETLEGCVNEAFRHLSHSLTEAYHSAAQRYKKLV